MNESKKPFSKNCHDGHRKRLFSLAYNAGVENISDIQAVETMLCFIFPRGDINPLAHRLLNHFTTFSNILDASLEDLKTVDGINETSAIKIKVFRQMISHYAFSNTKTKINVRKNRSELVSLIERLISFEPTEHFVFFAINHSLNVVARRIICCEEQRKVHVHFKDIYNFVNSTKAKFLIVAHNHPDGSCRPSQNDLDSTTYIRNLIRPFDCRLLDSLIVGCDGVYSIENDGFVKRYSNCDLNFLKIKNTQ